MCNDDLCRKPDLNQKLKGLKSTIERELIMIKELHEITGIMDSLFASSTLGNHSNADTITDVISNDQTDVVSSSTNGLGNHPNADTITDEIPNDPTNVVSSSTNGLPNGNGFGESMEVS